MEDNSVREVESMKDIRFFFDMDGTLAVWGNVEYEERLYEEGYFKKLAPMQNVVDTMNEMIEDGYNVYILSKYLEDSKFAFKEKKEWISKYIKGIKKENCILVKYSDNKSDYIPEGIKEKDFLIDDYTTNLIEFYESGGNAIKLLNGINHTKGTWTLEKVDSDSQKLKQDIIESVKRSMVKVIDRTLSKDKILIQYNINDLSKNTYYKGYEILNNSESLNSLEKTKQLKQYMLETKMNIIDRKDDVSKLSYLMREYLKDLFNQKLNKDNNCFVVEKIDIERESKKIEKRYRIISKELIINEFYKDVAIFKEKGFIQEDQNNNIVFQPEILTHYDFANDELIHQKSLEIENEYDFTINEKNPNGNIEMIIAAAETVMPIECGLQLDINQKINSEIEYE